MGNLHDLGFDAAAPENQSRGGFEPMPAGDYVGVFVSSSVKETKSGRGRYLELVFECVDGAHRGRRVYERLNLWNENEKAVQIARGTLGDICRAVGIMQPDDSSELHGRPVVAAIVLEERNDAPGKFSNRVKSYAAVGAARPVAPLLPSQRGVAGAAGASVPPWKRSA